MTPDETAEIEELIEYAKRALLQRVRRFARGDIAGGYRAHDDFLLCLDQLNTKYQELESCHTTPAPASPAMTSGKLQSHLTSKTASTVGATRKK